MIKKVLFLAHPELDHLAYMMFDGLYKVLGAENVLVYPYIRHYQGETDYWYITDFLKGYTKPPGFVSKHETPKMSFEELAGMIEEFDIVYLSSARTSAVNALHRFKKQCGDKLPPLVFGDGEDHHNLSAVEYIKKQFNPAVCFKRELLQEDLEARKDLQPLYPLPFSAITENLAQDESGKDINVFALFGNTHPIREKVVKLVISESGNKFLVCAGVSNKNPNKTNIPQLMRYEQYHELMSRAKINLVVRGEGYDTLRRFEAPCYSGLVISDKIPVITPNPFIDGENIVHFSDISELPTLIEYYLRNEEERQKIGKAGREHCMKYHTTEARARYFLKQVSQARH